MTNPYRELAEIHKEAAPVDERSLDDLEAHFRILYSSSLLVQAYDQVAGEQGRSPRRMD